MSYFEADCVDVLCFKNAVFVAYRKRVRKLSQYHVN
jgi:hypothetical protein